MELEHAQEPATAPGEKRGPGRNLPIAVGVGLGLGALVLLTLYTVKVIFLGVVVVFIGLAAIELVRAFAGHGIRIGVPPLLAGGLAMLVGGYVWGPAGLVGAAGLTALAMMLWRMYEGQNGYVRDMTASVFAAAYVPFLAGFVALMLAGDDGADRVVTFIAVTVASDIGGFFAGTFLGRHKMAPAISPKKTWEGFSGSALTCMLCGGLMMPLLLDGTWWQGVILGVAAVCSATLGDLIESMVKRDLGIKDMGTLLPGHGGVMDRLDSLLATAPIAWLAFQVFL